MNDYNPRRWLPEYCLWLVVVFILSVGAVIAAGVTLIVSMFIGGK